MNFFREGSHIYLVEHILSYLDARSLLAVASVSTAFIEVGWMKTGSTQTAFFLSLSKTNLAFTLLISQVFKVPELGGRQLVTAATHSARLLPWSHMRSP